MLKRILCIIITAAIVFSCCIVCSAKDNQPESAAQIKSLGQMTHTMVSEIDVNQFRQQIVNDINYESLTLKYGFGYYRGSLPMCEITKIVFTNQHPNGYDEKWFANVTDTEEITGYLVGTAVYIVGDKIYTHEQTGYMLAGSNTYGEPLWCNLKEIVGLENLDVSRTVKFDRMFYGNQYLTELDLNNWDMSNATSLRLMFGLCNNLETIRINQWDVSSVEDFSAMFQGNNWVGDMSLKNIDVSQWNTQSAVQMNHIFYGCAELKSIDVSNWDVRNVITFSHMFADCHNLRNIDLTKWETNSVISFDAMFNDCYSLTTINISNLQTSTCQQFSQLFEDCINLQEIIGIECLDTSNASSYAFSEMFKGCSSLTSLNLSQWDVSRADNMARMFAYCPQLKSLDVTGWDISNVEFITEMFYATNNVIIKGIEDDLLLSLRN